MLTIELSNLRFYAYHGLYEEEKLLGGEFEVNVSVSLQPKKDLVENIDETIDYTEIFQLIKNSMEQQTELLETLVTGIAQKILSQFLLAEEVIVSVKKIKPPIISFEGTVGVRCELKRNQE